MSVFSNRLRALRKTHRLTQEELGKRINVTKVSVSGYESGNRTPDMETLQKIADTLDTSVDYLLGRTSDPDILKTKAAGKTQLIDPDLGVDISELSPEELEFLNELKQEVAFKDFLKDPEDKRRDLIETVKMLMRGRRK